MKLTITPISNSTVSTPLGVFKPGDAPRSDSVTAARYEKMGADLTNLVNLGLISFTLTQDTTVDDKLEAASVGSVASQISTTDHLTGSSPDGGTAVGTYVDTAVAYTASGAKLFSIRTGGSEKAYFNKDGQLYTQAVFSTFYNIPNGGAATINGAQFIGGANAGDIGNFGYGVEFRSPMVGGGDTLVGVCWKFDTNFAITTAKLVSVRNNGAEKFIISLTGAVTATDIFQATGVGTNQGVLGRSAVGTGVQGVGGTSGSGIVGQAGVGSNHYGGEFTGDGAGDGITAVGGPQGTGGTFYGNASRGNLRLLPLTATPSAPAEGDMWYENIGGTKHLKFYDGTTTHTVTMTPAL